MTLNELINIASGAYPDGLIAETYWDFKRQRPRRNPKGGDTLALFIANEIADTYDPTALDEQQIEAVVKAIARARDDLDSVSAALNGEMEKRHSAVKAASRQRKEG